MQSITPSFPGFGQPLYGQGPEGSFPNALNWEGSGFTVREKVMLDLMNSITEKPEWDRKVFDESITQKWRQEALDAEGMDITEKMLDWIIAELQDKASSFKDDGIVSILDVDVAVVKSDTAIPSHLRHELKAACRPLETVPSKFKDWHPGSDEKVLDLVHPSLFPLVYGRSKVITSQRIGMGDCISFMDQGEITVHPEQLEPKPYGNLSDKPEGWSRHFQWLPCLVRFQDGGTVKISSYINNLHPSKFPDLYRVIEECIAKAIPLWDRTLSSIREFKEPRITMECTEYHWPLGEQMPDDFMPEQAAIIEDEWDREDKRHEIWKQSRILVHPEPGTYTSLKFSEAEQFDLKKRFEHSGLQVIVKLANIELTPQKPRYEGGSWHIEGQMNERICASALYYYDSENITESFLGFRQSINAEILEEKAYDQDDYGGVEDIYNVKQDEPRVQELGQVSTKSGRLIAFPNVLQHRVSPFSLQDGSKPGHRKILAMFLVDPHIPILSTAHVPPQQKSWWSDEIRNDGSLSRLPVELVDKVMDEVSGAPMTMEEAKSIREKLMEERKDFVAHVEKEIQNYTFSFCEH